MNQQLTWKLGCSQNHSILQINASSYSRFQFWVDMVIVFEGVQSERHTMLPRCITLATRKLVYGYTFFHVLWWLAFFYDDTKNNGPFCIKWLSVAHNKPKKQNKKFVQANAS